MNKRTIFSIVAIYLVATFLLISKDTNCTPHAQAFRVQECDVPFAQYMRFEEAKRRVQRESSLTANLAVYNDELLKHGYKYWTRIPAAVIGPRLLAITVFPVTLMLDTVYAYGMYVYSTVHGDAEDAKWYRMRLFKDFLGLIATPASLVGADLVTNHFIPLEKAHTAICPYGKLYSAHGVELYPKTIEEVQEIVRKAKESDRKITVAGKLFSQGKQALPMDYKGLVIHMDHLNEVVIDSAQKTAICKAGATWEDVQKAANENALAVQVMQASNVFSIGGSLSINCHGWDHQAGALDQTVRAILLVNADGECLRLTPEDELFHLAIGGLGAFGVIVEAEIALTDNTLLRYTGESIPPSSYLPYFRDQILTNPDIHLHYYRLSLDPKHLFEEGIAVNYIAEGDPEVAALEGEPDKGSRLDRIELQTLRRIKPLAKWAWKEEKHAALQTFSATRNEIMHPPIRAILSESNLDTEWLQEYFVKPDHLEPFLNQLRNTLIEYKVPVFNASIRYVAKNDSKSFNYAPDGERFAIVLFFNQSLAPQEIAKTKQWIHKVLAALEELEGSYYLPYQAFPTLEEFRKSYPNWEQIREAKNKWDPSGRFDNGFLSYYLTGSKSYESLPTEYHALFAKETGMRPELTAFIDRIFLQVNADKLLCLMDEILAKNVSDEEVYPLLLSRIGEAKNGWISTMRAGLRSLSSLQNELADQAHALIGSQPLENYVEIGYPGRMIRPLKKRLNLKGKMIVVNTEQKLSDYVQSGFPSPIDQFVALNDYEPLSAKEIPAESVDLLSLFIGLHHIPEEKLEPFIQSIAKVLRPGGYMILMDHDAHSPEMQRFLSLVHSIFNAGTGVSVQEESDEYRNFKPLSYWIDLAAKNGLVWDGQKPRIREGDPTLNSLIVLRKPATETTKTSLDRPLRPGIQTYLTGPEWQNVRSSQNYAAFIEHTPFYQFPYFSEIGNFWHVYKESWKAARQHYSFFETITSEYMFMNTFIGVMMTMEYGAKGLISLPVSWIFTQEGMKEPLTTQIFLKEPGSEHAAQKEIPRYKKGTKILIDLANQGHEFISIEGHDRIQVDLLLDENAPIPTMANAKILYETPLIQTPAKRLVAYEIPIPLLAQNLRFLSAEGIVVDYIHDF